MGRLEFGETWVYESIVTALPGIDVSRPFAIGLQLVLFQVGITLIWWVYDFPTETLLAGTAAVVVATLGSVEMLRISDLVRSERLPDAYQRLLFGSSIEVVLAVLAFIALVTYLFTAGTPETPSLVDRLFGTEPPVVAVYLTLLVLWDVCYRIGTAWWAAVVALWRSVRYRFDEGTARVLRRADLEVVGFATAQLVLVPFVRDQTVIVAVIVGHVVAVWLVAGLSAVLVTTRAEVDEATDTGVNATARE
ncbi:DUF7530 family protein [Halomarina oriensis]|uniref:Uncharacterized protein n=1 Tax=Halomarina oriensis TaxID=671145 RepID=A0A6B0GHQ8_9EURY|nr:hypothetical protein [Halomarina oriensis]MWG34396.1 hypothetical protein [Halomarina oriensis]